MTPERSETRAPITPYFPFNNMDEDILLHEGKVIVDGTTEARGSIALTFSPDPKIEWRLDQSTKHKKPNTELGLEIHSGVASARFDAVFQGHDLHGRSQGFTNEVEFIGGEQPLDRVIAHWFNLPAMHSLTPPADFDDEGNGWDRKGRWEFACEGWSVTMDMRPDHLNVWDKAHLNGYVMTHVMELRRADGATFTADEADPVLSALHTGLSFAWGRWVAPMLPVGIGPDGALRWADWKPLHCAPAKNLASGWWYHCDLTSLEELCRLLITEFTDPDKREPRRIQLSMAVEAFSDTGFIEKRIIMGAATLEHIMWHTMVNEEDMEEDDYLGRRPYSGEFNRTGSPRKMNTAEDKLAALLKYRRIPESIDATLLPRAHEYSKKGGTQISGAQFVPRIRNKIVHPKDDQKAIYSKQGLLVETWCLTRHYVTLLILDSLGYTGRCRDMRTTTGMDSDVHPIHTFHEAHEA